MPLDYRMIGEVIELLRDSKKRRECQPPARIQDIGGPVGAVKDNQEGAEMHFKGKKVIVAGGSSGMGRQVALDVVDHGGSAVIVGRSKGRVDDTVAELTSRGGRAWGIAAELTDRAAVADVQRGLSEQHDDASLLVNAAGFFIPKPFVEYDAQFYDSYMELNYALFFLTQTVVEGMVARGEGGSIVNIGSM